MLAILFLLSLGILVQTHSFFFWKLGAAELANFWKLGLDILVSQSWLIFESWVLDFVVPLSWLIVENWQISEKFGLDILLPLSSLIVES